MKIPPMDGSKDRGSQRRDGSPGIKRVLHPGPEWYMIKKDFRSWVELSLGCQVRAKPLDIGTPC